MILKTLRKIFDPKVTDKKVKAISKEANDVIKDASKRIQSHNDLLKKNGVTLRIFIASGGHHDS